jgi:hypothetical protein
MHDYPILGAVLFAIGSVIVSLACFGSFEAADASNSISSMVVGNIIAFNGVLLVTLGSRKLGLARAHNDSVGTQAR